MKKLAVGCWLLAVSVAMAAGVAQAEPVEYRDYDEAVSPVDEGISDRSAELLRTDGSVEPFTSRDEAFDAANAAVAQQPRYALAESGDTGSLELDDQAKPRIDGDAEVDFNAEDGTAVSVWPTNVKPGLFYGLGRSDSLTGPFVVEVDGWVQAGADSKLPRALTAPKGDGACGFYRVFVK